MPFISAALPFICPSLQWQKGTFQNPAGICQENPVVGKWNLLRLCKLHPALNLALGNHASAAVNNHLVFRKIIRKVRPA